MSMQQPPSSKQKLDLAEFPDHIIYSILLKLPAKSLIRFWSLSKTWRDTIMSSSFAKQHMQYVKEATTSSCNVMLSLISHYKRRKHDFFSYQISSNEYDDRQIVRPVRMNRFIFKHGLDSLAWFQSCDGLLCLALKGSKVSTSFIHIWNPATNKHKKITWPLLSDDDNSTSHRRYKLKFLGFGYESSIDDYKIVVSEGLRGGGRKFRAQVMSLKENTWRVVDLKIPPHVLRIIGYQPGRESNVITVNGDVYWLAVRQEDDQSRQLSFVLLNFNLADESISLLPLPEERYTNEILAKLATLDGSLFLFLCYKPSGETSKSVDLWKLQGHKTWCKVGIIPTVVEYGPAKSPQKLHPMGFNLSGHVIMINRFDDSLFVYIPQENKFVKLDITNNVLAPGRAFGFNFVHMDTLVSP